MTDTGGTRTADVLTSSGSTSLSPTTGTHDEPAGTRDVSVDAPVDAPRDASDGSGISRCPDENELVLLADGMLADARRAAIDHHLDGCATCTRLVAELAGMAAPMLPVPARYKVVRQLGAGAMGVVWEAEDTHLGRKVALKFVRPDAGTGSSPSSRSDRVGGNRAAGDRATRERRARLFREARALAQLRHPNVVNVYDVGESGDEVFLALELVIGTDARAWCTGQPRTTDEVIAVWRQVMAGVAAVHRAGIVHRDIKPENILVADDGRVLVGDFGLATGDPAETLGRLQGSGGVTGSAAALTATGAIVGTPIYMAREQLLGEPASQKSDQYALCASMWEALLGERPFSGPSLGAIAMAMLEPPAIPSQHPHPHRAGRSGLDAYRHVFEALVRGLDPNPSKRWPTVDALLAACAVTPRRRSRSRAWLALGAAGLAAAATVGVLAWRDHAARGAPPDASTVTAAREPIAHDVDAATPEQQRAPVADVEASDGVADETPDAAAGAGKRRAPQPTAPRGAAAKAATSASAANGATTSVAGAASTAPGGFVTQSDWKRIIDRATDKLGFGDGAECLQLLSTMPPPPRVMAEQAETLRAMCTMRAGDCATGRAKLAATARAHGWDATRSDAAIDAADLAYCPLDAGPRTRWAERARYRLLVASGSNMSCRPILAFMQKHDVQLANVREQLVIETTCKLNDHDCAGARATNRKAFVMDEKDPNRIAELQTTADATFATSFPQCK